MTAKRKPRGTLARLEALEAKRAEQVQAVEDVKSEQCRDALDALDVDTLEDLRGWNVAQDDSPAWARFLEVTRALEGAYPDTPHPDRLDAVAWCDVLEVDGVPFPVPDRLPDFVAYFEGEARRCEALLSGLDAASLPDGVSGEEARQVFQYVRAGWAFWASMGRVLIEWGSV